MLNLRYKISFHKNPNQRRQLTVLTISAGFTYRLYRLKPRASRSKGASNKLWYALSQWSVYDHLD